MSTEAKLIQVSLDGSTFSTLPGSSGEISIESSDNDNTIFGNVFSSSLPGVKDWSLSGNAWLRQTPGFKATVKRQGVATTFTGEPMTLVSGKTYMIADFTKSVWDYVGDVVVTDNASTVAASDIQEIDYLFGRVTFKDSYTVTGPVTVDGKFSPTAAFGCANSISLTQNAEATTSSCFEITQAANGYNTYEAGLKTVSMELSGFYRQSNDFFQLLDDGDTIVIEVDWEGDGETMSRGIFKLQSTSQSGEVGSQEEYSATFNLYVPEDVLPFSWYFGVDSNAPQGMLDIINSWVTRENLFVRYYPTGNVTGATMYAGETVVTDASLSTSVDAIGELSLTAQGDGELIASVI
jgi:hypothetical protein